VSCFAAVPSCQLEQATCARYVISKLISAAPLTRYKSLLHHYTNDSKRRIYYSYINKSNTRTTDHIQSLASEYSHRINSSSSQWTAPLIQAWAANIEITINISQRTSKQAHTIWHLHSYRTHPRLPSPIYYRMAQGSSLHHNISSMHGPSHQVYMLCPRSAGVGPRPTVVSQDQRFTCAWWERPHVNEQQPGFFVIRPFCFTRVRAHDASPRRFLRPQAPTDKKLEKQNTATGPDAVWLNIEQDQGKQKRNAKTRMCFLLLVYSYGFGSKRFQCVQGWSFTMASRHQRHDTIYMPFKCLANILCIL
jgi:hypothetical protein